MEASQMMLACVVCRYAVDAFDGSCLPAGWITVSNAVLPNSGTSVTDFLVSRNVVDAATLAAATVAASVATSTANGGSTTQTTTLLCGACASVVGACDYAYARYVEQLNQLKRRVGYYVKTEDQQQQSAVGVGGHYYYGYAQAGSAPAAGSSGSSISASCMKMETDVLAHGSQIGITLGRSSSEGSSCSATGISFQAAPAANVNVNHAQSPTEPKPKRNATTWLKCKHCLYRAKKQVTMDDHVKNNHPDVAQSCSQVFSGGILGAKSKFSCDRCSKTFVSDKMLIDHLNVVHGVQPSSSPSAASSSSSSGISSFTGDPMAIAASAIAHAAVPSASSSSYSGGGGGGNSGSRPEMRPKKYLCPHPPCECRYTTRMALNRHLASKHLPAGEGGQPSSSATASSSTASEVKPSVVLAGPPTANVVGGGDVGGNNSSSSAPASSSSTSTYASSAPTFHCSDCEKAYRNKELFLAHRFEKHGVRLDGLKDYVCPHCAKTFHVKSAFKSHVANHTGERIFSCKFCEYGSNYSGNVYKHMKLVHQGEYKQKKNPSS